MSLSLRVICLSLSGCAMLLAQIGGAQSAPSKGFTVTLLQGEGVVNPLPRPPATHVSLRVADTKGQPIRNAVTVVELPEAGASAAFADGSTVKVLLTNDKGEAAADLKSNEVPGKYHAKVTVNYLGQSSMIRLNQENAFPYGAPTAVNSRHAHKHGFFSKKTVLFVAAAAVAATVAVVASHRGQAPGDNSGGITITPGNGTVGEGH